jgi:hypothetical protein
MEKGHEVMTGVGYVYCCNEAGWYVAYHDMLPEVFITETADWGFIGFFFLDGQGGQGGRLDSAPGRGITGVTSRI